MPTRPHTRTSGSNEQMTVLGVDPGLERTGYAVLTWPLSRVLDAGVIRSTTTARLPRRLAELDEGISEVLSEHAIDLMGIEELYAHYRHPRTAILMGHARAVMLLAAARRSIEVLDMPATRVKKALTGNGHASKVQIQRAIMATLRLRVLPEPPDVADAMAIAVCAGLSRCATAL